MKPLYVVLAVGLAGVGYYLYRREQYRRVTSIAQPVQTPAQRLAALLGSSKPFGSFTT